MFGKARVLMCALVVAVAMPAIASAQLPLDKFKFQNNNSGNNFLFSTKDGKSSVFSKIDDYLDTHTVQSLMLEFKALIPEPKKSTYTGQKTFLDALDDTLKITFKLNEVVLKWEKPNGSTGKRTYVSAVPGPIVGAGLPLLLGVAGFLAYRSRKTESVAA